MSEQISRPTTPVTISLSDNKERVLRYSIGTMKRLKEKFGESLFKGGLNNLDEEKLPVLIWHGLNHSLNPDPITQEQVEELIDAQMLPYVMAKFFEAFGGKAKNDKAPAPAPIQETLPNPNLPVN